MSNISVRPKTLQSLLRVEGFKGFSYFFSLRNNTQTKNKSPSNHLCFFREKIQIPDVYVYDRSLATRKWLPVFPSRVFVGRGWVTNCSRHDQQGQRGKELSAGGDKRKMLVLDKQKSPRLWWRVYCLSKVLMRNLHRTPRHPCAVGSLSVSETQWTHTKKMAVAPQRTRTQGHARAQQQGAQDEPWKDISASVGKNSWKKPNERCRWGRTRNIANYSCIDRMCQEAKVHVWVCK